MRLLLLSNSKTEGMGYLEHAAAWLRDFLPATVNEVLFVPYAGVTKTHYDYVEEVRPVFASLGVNVTSLHRAHDAIDAVRRAQAIALGGGNTWNLLRELRRQRVLPAIRQRVLEGMPYLGWSAGANLACPTIMTTNDMPICDPGGFDALALVPFQINPHYLTGNPPGFHGETREERLREFGVLHPEVWVAGLPEGSGLRIEDRSVALVGRAGCRLFRGPHSPRDAGPGEDLSFLLA
jgi:dipeptidase E